MPRVRSLVALTFLLTALASSLTMMEGIPPVPSAALVKPQLESQALRVVWGYVGRDLDKAREELPPLLTALRVLDPVRAATSRESGRHLELDRNPLDEFEYPFGLHPRYLWAFGQVDWTRGFVVFERAIIQPHPGSTNIRLTAFDHAGVVFGRSEFTTSYRCYLSHAQLRRIDGVENPVVVIHTPPILGPDFARQFYALIGDRFDLVRLEGNAGAATRNNYSLTDSRCGPLPPRQSAEQWEADCMSGERARVLRALVWLGGHHLLHLTSGQVYDSHTMEDLWEAELSRRVRERPLVAARLRELAARGDVWEREAAMLALTPQDVKWR